MNPNPSSSFPAVAIFFAAFFVSGAHAAKAPLSTEELENQSSVILVGEVLEVTSKNEKSKVETGIGIGIGIFTDCIYTIRLKVSSVRKAGNGSTKPGDIVVVRAWQPVRRIPPLAGLQGHETIPAKGARITVFVAKKSGSDYKPILPNGIVIEKPDSRE